MTVFRIRFLQTNSNDIEKCLLGDDNIKVFSPIKIDKLNLDFVWSVEYGVNISSVINVASDFLVKIIRDTSIVDEFLGKVYPKIFVPILKNRDKNFWSKKLVQACRFKLKSPFISTTTNIDKRIRILEDLIQEYIFRGNYQIV